MFTSRILLKNSIKKDIQKINYIHRSNCMLTCPENNYSRNLKFLEIIRKQKKEITELQKKNSTLLETIEIQRKRINEFLQPRYTKPPFNDPYGQFPP